jgi:glycerol-3-phosphate acyltransferase PlsX
MIDVGANVDCRPVHLLQFGFMAHAFARSCLGIKDPTIGLLSIGEEGGKGNELVKAAHSLFRESRLNFAGNVEGRDIFSGVVHIVVCDGFVGNVALKVSEGLAKAVGGMIREEMTRSIQGRIGLALGKKAFLTLREALDYETYGGAPILGINGIGIVCHGSSSERAIKNGIKRAAEYHRNHFLEKLTGSMDGFGAGLAKAS